MGKAFESGWQKSVSHLNLKPEHVESGGAPTPAPSPSHLREEQLRLAQDYGDMGVWSWEVKTGKIHLGPGFEKLYGVPPGGLQAYEDFSRRLEPEELRRVEQERNQALAERRPFSVEFRVRHPSGEERWLISKGQGEYDASGELLRVVGVNIDITQRKHAEEAVARLSAASERQRRLYETILSNTPDLVYVFDLNHRFTYANQALLMMWGRTWDEAIGKNCLELGYEPWHAAMHDREIERVIATKQPIRGEVPFIGTNGRRIYDYIFVPVFGANGEVEAVAGTTRDVTERKQKEETLRFMAESMPQKIFTARPNGEMDYFNQQWVEFAGLPLEQLHGWGWLQLVHPEDREENVRRWKQSIQSGEPFCLEHRLQERGGQYRWHITRAHAMQEPAGQITMWIGSVTDIDEQKRAEEKLEQTVIERTAKLQETVQDLEAFSYSIAHDMRAPLRSMQGFAGILKEDFAPQMPAEAQALLQRIVSSAGRMDQLILDILNYSKVVRGELELRAVDSHKIVLETIESYPQLGKAHADITVVGTLPRILANEAAFTQVVSNLLGNAVKFVAPGIRPTIRVWAEVGAGRAQFFFQDNGIGIPGEGQKRLFQIFQRVHTPRAYEGTGIGLAIVKKAVERMGGRVGVVSEPGQGSRFWVELNLAGPAPAAFSPGSLA